MMGAVFGSVVVPFGKAMYDINLTNWERKPPSGSMFEKYGLAIRKFGIAFEADPGETNSKPCFLLASQLTGNRPVGKSSDENDI
jgi:hypothetical protein